MKIDTKLMTVTEGNDQFYPTPNDLAEKMLAGMDWDMMKSGRR